MRIRLVILILIGLSLVPFLASQILVAEKNMQTTVSMAEQSLQLSLVRAEDLFGGVQTELENLSSTIALIDSLRYSSPELCGETLRKIAAAHGRIEAIALLTPKGVVYCASEPKAMGISLSERQYFADSLQSQGIVWGDLQVGKVTGQIMIPSARAVRHDGEVSFVVIVLLDIAALKKQTFQQFQLHVAQAALMNGRGKILDTEVFDQDAAPFDSPTLQRTGAVSTGVIVPATHNSHSTLLGVMKLPMADGRIVFAVPIGQIYAEARREMVAAVVLVCLETVLIAAFLLIALELLVLRSLRRITAFASLITAGNHSQRVALRSPFSEFAILSSTLNLMIDKLENASFTDALTGLANRRALEAHLDRCNERLETDGIGVSLAMIDIDHFKLFNDRFGHSTGDSVLQMVGETLKSFVMSGEEMAARYGGEEFTLVLSDTRAESIVNRLEAVRSAVENLDIVHPDSRHGRVTISIGFAVVHPGGRAQEALERADLALYAAKECGRNRVDREARPLSVSHDTALEEWPTAKAAS